MYTPLNSILPILGGQPLSCAVSYLPADALQHCTADVAQVLGPLPAASVQPISALLQEAYNILVTPPAEESVIALAQVLQGSEALRAPEQTATHIANSDQQPEVRVPVQEDKQQQQYQQPHDHPAQGCAPPLPLPTPAAATRQSTSPLSSPPQPAAPAPEPEPEPPAAQQQPLRQRTSQLNPSKQVLASVDTLTATTSPAVATPAQRLPRPLSTPAAKQAGADIASQPRQAKPDGPVAADAPGANPTPGVSEGHSLTPAKHGSVSPHIIKALAGIILAELEAKEVAVKSGLEPSAAEHTLAANETPNVVTPASRGKRQLPKDTETPSLEPAKATAEEQRSAAAAATTASNEQASRTEALTKQVLAAITANPHETLAATEALSLLVTSAQKRSQTCKAPPQLPAAKPDCPSSAPHAAEACVTKVSSAEAGKLTPSDALPPGGQLSSTVAANSPTPRRVSIPDFAAAAAVGDAKGAAAEGSPASYSSKPSHRQQQQHEVSNPWPPWFD